MRKLLFFAMLAIFCFNANAQAPVSHPSVYAGTKLNLASDKETWGIDLGAGYKKFLYKAFFVYPQAGFFYQNYKGFDHVNPSTGGLNLRCDIGLQNPLTPNNGLDIFTGPDFDWNFKCGEGPHYNMVSRSGSGYEECGPGCRRFILRWRAGLSANIGRYSIRAAYAFQLTKTELSDRRIDLVEITLAYRFKI